MEIVLALLADEGQYHTSSEYMGPQTGIGPEHRHFLVSWMMTVQPLDLLLLCQAHSSDYLSTHYMLLLQ